VANATARWDEGGTRGSEKGLEGKSLLIENTKDGVQRTQRGPRNRGNQRKGRVLRKKWGGKESGTMGRASWRESFSEMGE